RLAAELAQQRLLAAAGAPSAPGRGLADFLDRRRVHHELVVVTIGLGIDEVGVRDAQVVPVVEGFLEAIDLVRADGRSPGRALAGTAGLAGRLGRRLRGGRRGRLLGGAGGGRLGRGRPGPGLGLRGGGPRGRRLGGRRLGGRLGGGSLGAAPGRGGLGGRLGRRGLGGLGRRRLRLRRRGPGRGRLLG